MSNTCVQSAILLLILCTLHHFNCTLAITGDNRNIRPVERNEYQPVVCIMNYRPGAGYNGSLVCSGVFISSTHVLTAEHCLLRVRYHITEILVGSGILADSVSYYSIWWLSFMQWSIIRQFPITTHYNDIMLIKVIGTPIRFAPGRVSRVTPIQHLYGTTVQTFGCGSRELGNLPGIIKTARLRVLSNRDCKHLVESITNLPATIPNNMICTNNNPIVHTQNGDSGGPVLFNGDIVAINIGICPVIDMQFNPNQVNVHVFLSSYTAFFDDAFTYL